jgi:hypothetical protein
MSQGIKDAAMAVFEVMKKIPYVNKQGEYNESENNESENNESENKREERLYFKHKNLGLVLDIYATHGKYHEEMAYRGVEDNNAAIAILQEFRDDPLLDKYPFVNEIKEKIDALIAVIPKEGGRRRKRRVTKKRRSTKRRSHRSRRH